MNTEDIERDRIWDDLYRKIVALLRPHGRNDAIGEGEYWILDDNYGWRRQTIYVFDLKILDPVIVAALRDLLNGLPDWDIVLAIDVPGKENTWPPMGLTLRKHEIVDGLNRDYLPEPYRTLVIPGSRPGTGYD
jgi:hypothetical protein